MADLAEKAIKIYVRDDDGRTRTLDLINELSVGRASKNAIQLDQRDVSRHHARIYRNGNRVMVEDLGSHNGTKLNGERIEQATALEPGDEVHICGFALWVERGGDERRYNPTTVRINCDTESH